MVPMMLFALAAAASEPATLAPLTQDPQKMSQSEIRAYNTGRSSKDPDYIRCIRAETTGSIVRKIVTCHTNSQWAIVEGIGNQNARDAYGSVPSAGTAQSN
jgi:hypothetical protein